MDLTIKQQQGLELAVTRHKAKEKYSVISGFAGTGKSTLVQHIITALGVSIEDVVYCAYTGKATLVLSRNGCKNVSTLHKLLYTAKLNPRTGTFSFIPRSTLAYPYKVVVVDEVSMVSSEIWSLLLRHNIYILALGDPGQLGPIRAADDLGLLKKPHIFLDEIMRQAEGNEIIKLSMKIRNGEPLTEFDGEHVRIVQSGDLTTGMLEWADQILCAKNATRANLNHQLRQSQGRGTEPEVGDKIICLHNYWETFSFSEDNPLADGDPLVNGTLGYLTSVKKYYNHNLGFDTLKISFEDEIGGYFENLVADYKLLMENIPSLSRADFGRLARNPRTQAMIPKEFAFGSVITTWKAQGSEWDNVLLFEEDFPYAVDDHKRYLYTGITRASQKIVVVKK